MSRKNYGPILTALSKKFFLFIAVLFALNSALAQAFTVKGVVRDASGEPLPFVNVTVKNSKTIVSSTKDGTFQIWLKTLPATLIFTQVGFEQQEKKIEKISFRDSIMIMDITLVRRTTALEEVVVVGYSVARKKEAVGYASASISSKELTSVDVSSGLTGKVSGLSISSTSKKESKPTLIPVDEGTGPQRAGLLTAGEVNDFKKWKMWEDYAEKDFKTHSVNWQLYPTNRFSVQIQNKQLKAITGQKIYLIDKKNNDTIWTAISDNTGKAELWSGFAGKAVSSKLVLCIEKEKMEYPAAAFSQGINRLVIDKPCMVSDKVEIAFLVDATGSMADEIQYLQKELQDILEKTVVKDSLLSLKTGAVFYRDAGDEYLTKVGQLSTDISTTIDFIKQQSADGGGDFPEAVNAGLKAAIRELQWTENTRAKIIFLLMDAPPHDDAKTEMAELMAEAAAKGIRIVPVACSGTDKSTEFVMRSIALATNGTYVFLTDHSGIGNSHIKPTTDDFKVEFLNDLLARVISQMCFVNACDESNTKVAPVSAYTNPEKVSVYPNPASGPVTFETNKKIKELFVTDFTGKIIARVPTDKNSTRYRIDLSAFPSATYLIRYVTDDNKSGAEKVVIAR